jgi:PEP-CTERM motif
MKLRLVAIAVAAVLSAQAHAALVNVDLSGATTGTLIGGVGADFSQVLGGLSVSGISVTGTVTAPLSLTAAGSITVASFNPGVSATSNSLLSQPGNGAPLAMLLDMAADSLAWTMGFGNGGSVTADFYSAAGALVGTQTFGGLSGYSLFSVSGIGTFQAVQFRDNNDASGLRFQNFSYNSVVAQVPEPTTTALLAVALLAAGLAGRARRQTRV